MPVIPADFQVNRTPFAGVPEAQASPGAFAAPGQALAQAGREVSAEANQWAEQYRAALQQKQAANLAFGGMTELSAAQEKWSRVPDAQQAIAGFNQDAQQIHQKYAAMTSDPMVQSEVLRQLNGHTIWSQMNVQNRSFNLESSAHRAEIDEHLDAYAQKALTAPDAIARAQWYDAGIAELRGAGKAGWLFPEDQERRELKYRDDFWGNALRQDLQNNPAEALRALKAGEYDQRLSATKREQMQPAIDQATVGVLGGAIGAGFGFGGPSGMVKGAGAPLNNPGNIRAPGGGFRQFGSYDEGIAAIRQNLVAYQDQHGINTLAGIISRWAPPSENPTQQLIANAAARTGFNPGQTLDLHDPATQQKLVDAIVAQEQGGGQKVAQAGPATATDVAQPPIDMQRPDLEGAVADVYRRIRTGEMPERIGEAIVANYRRQFTEYMSATHSDRMQVLRDMRDATAAAQDGQSVDTGELLDRAKRLLDPDQFDDLNDKFQQAVVAGQAKVGVEFADPATSANIINAQKKQLDEGGPNYAKMRTRYNALLETERNKQQQLGPNGDPAAYVRNAPDVAAGYAAAQANPQGGMEAAIAKSLDKQQFLGVRPEDQRVLTKQEAGDLASQLASKDPGTVDVARELIPQYVRQYGRYWHQAFGDVARAGMPAGYQVLASMDQPQQAGAAASFQQMLRANGRDGYAKLKETTAKDMDPELRDNMAGTMRPFLRTMSDPHVKGMFWDAVENLARWYYSGGKNPSDALAQAYNGIIGSRWDFDGNLRVPKDANGNSQMGVVEDAARGLQDSIRPEQLPLPPRTENLSPERRQQIAQDAVRSGEWHTNENDDGAVLVLNYADGGQAEGRYADGRRIEFKFADAKQMNATPAAQPPMSGDMPSMPAPSNRALPPEGPMRGARRLLPEYDAIAMGSIRPLGPGEYVTNPDGSISSEITTTVQSESLNRGRPTILPTVWLVRGEPQRVSPRQAIAYAATANVDFPSFKTEEEAAAFERQRHAQLDRAGTAGLASIPALWKRKVESQ